MGGNKIKKIMVVGGAGFIGSHITDRLLSLNYKVVVLDNLLTGRRENLNSRAKFYLADIRDNKLLGTIFEKERPEIVINEAAKVYWREEEKDPIIDTSISVLGTLNLLKNCIKYKTKKFIFASSVSVYGQPKELRVKEDSKISFANFPLSIFSYGLAKYIAEKYIYFYHKKYNLNYIILRYAHVYGPRQQFRQKDVIFQFIKNILKNKPVKIHQNGNQVRDYIYIKDVVAATVLSIKEGNNITLNIGSGEPTSVINLIELLSKIIKKPIKVEHIKTKEKSRGLYTDISLAKKKIGWFPKVSLYDGITHTLNYFKDVKN